MVQTDKGLLEAVHLLFRADEGRALVSILQFTPKVRDVFDDEVSSLLAKAFDDACRDLHDRGQPPIVLEIIAQRIVDAARRGERNIDRLREAGLSALGETRG